MITQYWIFTIVFVAFWLFAFALAIMGGWRYGRRHGYAEIKDEYKALQVEHGVLTAKADVLQQENEHLQSQIADRDEALLGAHAEIKSLNMQTKEMAEIATQSPIPARPVQRPRKKAGGSA